MDAALAIFTASQSESRLNALSRRKNPENKLGLPGGRGLLG